MTYQYWVIRYVPNLARGEFLNIGIVCGHDGGDWASRFELNSSTVHGLTARDLNETRAWVSWFQRTIDAHLAVMMDDDGSPINSGWIEHLRQRQASSIQFSVPAPIEATSAQAAVDLLYPHIVERPITRRSRSITRKAIRGELRDNLIYQADYVLGQNLFVQPTVRVGRQRFVFDIARTDRTANTRLTQAWAFNVATLDMLERDIQSWNYLVTRLRQDGGRIAGTQLASDLPIEVAFDQPATGTNVEWRADIFAAAQEAWELNEVVAKPFTEFAEEFLNESLVAPHA
ncbi:MAG TPA: DUF3037 domain-containing protein [Microbacteriaceae bacterium]